MKPQDVRVGQKVIHSGYPKEFIFTVAGFSTLGKCELVTLRDHMGRVYSLISPYSLTILEPAKHPHAEVIKAWADGAEIEFRPNDYGVWSAVVSPTWCKTYEYRIKLDEPVVAKKAKYVPTKQDYQAGIRISQLKYELRHDKINKQINQLVNEDRLLQAQYSRKLRIGKMLEKEAPL